MAWSFYFPESIASYQEASRLDPQHPMPYWGLAHAIGPIQTAGTLACRTTPREPARGHPDGTELANNGTDKERDMINALFVLYNKDAIARRS